MHKSTNPPPLPLPPLPAFPVPASETGSLPVRAGPFFFLSCCRGRRQEVGIALQANHVDYKREPEAGRKHLEDHGEEQEEVLVERVLHLRFIRKNAQHEEDRCEDYGAEVAGDRQKVQEDLIGGPFENGRAEGRRNERDADEGDGGIADTVDDVQVVECEIVDDGGNCQSERCKVQKSRENESEAASAGAEGGGQSARAAKPLLVGL